MIDCLDERTWVGVIWGSSQDAGRKTLDAALQGRCQVGKVFDSVQQAIADADKFLVEVGQDLVPVNDDRVPERLKAKYLRTVIRAASEEEGTTATTTTD